MQKTLSALVVHDIKNALALLEIDLEQLNHHKDVPPEGARAYRRCIELKNRLVSFLTLYKRDQSGLQSVAVEVDLAEFVEDMVSNSQSVMMAKSHQGHPIMVYVDRDKTRVGGTTDGFAMFDENLVELALESALNNAVRYARHHVVIWFEQEADKLVFKVLDDGAGVGVTNELMERKIAENILLDRAGAGIVQGSGRGSRFGWCVAGKRPGWRDVVCHDAARLSDLLPSA